MNNVQKIYNWIKGLRLKWLADILKSIQDIVVEVALSVGKSYIDDLKNKIIEVSAENISSEDKFKKVFTYARVNINVDTLKDSALNLLLEVLVNKCKREGSI